VLVCHVRLLADFLASLVRRMRRVEIDRWLGPVLEKF
jgi:hypothetical protein